MDGGNLQPREIAVRYGIVQRGGVEAEVLPALGELQVVVVYAEDDVPGRTWHRFRAIMDGNNCSAGADQLDGGGRIGHHRRTLDLDVEDLLSRNIQRRRAFRIPQGHIGARGTPVLPAVGVIGNVQFAESLHLLKRIR